MLEYEQASNIVNNDPSICYAVYKKVLSTPVKGYKATQNIFARFKWIPK